MPVSARAFPATPLSSRKNEPSDDVRALQAALVERGCGPCGKEGRFDDATVDAVKRFQIRFSDLAGRPLTVDGIVGPMTWQALVSGMLSF